MEQLFRAQREISTFNLKHPNIVDVSDSFFTETGDFVIVSELGKSDLKTFIKKRMDEGKEFELDEIIKIYLPLLNALDFMH